LKALPPGARHGGRLHLEVRNLYALGMAEATFRRLSAPGRRPFILTRSGFPGIQRHAFAWTGDNASRFEDLALSIPMVLSLGLSGLPFAGADVGGFNEDAIPELLTRWMWLGALYPFFPNHTALGTRRQEPYAFGEPWTGWMREALRFRYRLLPYLYALARQAHEDGLPLWRPLFAYFPQELEAYREDQFLPEEALMAAPVVRQGEAVREVWIPPGTWQDLFTGEVFGAPVWSRFPPPFPAFPSSRRRARPCPWPSPATPPPPPAFPTSPSAWPWGRRSGGGSTRTRGTARRRESGGRCAAPLTESASTSFWKSLGKGSWPRSWGCPGPFGSGEGSGGRGGFFWTWEKGRPGPAGPEMRLSQKARHQGHGGL